MINQNLLWIMVLCNKRCTHHIIKIIKNKVVCGKLMCLVRDQVKDNKIPASSDGARSLLV